MTGQDKKQTKVNKETSDEKKEEKTLVSETGAVVLPREVGEEKTILTWQAPVRPFKKRDKEYYTTIASIAFLVIIILVFLREYLLIAVVISFAFVAYVLAAVPPEITEHKLTDRGIRTAGKLYRWADLQRYWIAEKFGEKMIVVQTAMVFPGQLLLLLGKADLGKMQKILNDYLPLDEPEPTFLDKSADWLSKKVPLESEKS